MTKKCIYNILLALGLSISVCAGSQAIVVQDSLMVTDVTPVQFCVVWATSEPASGSVKVFFDPNYIDDPNYQVNPNDLIIYRDAKVVFESPAHPPAEEIGVMKVKVTGLEPDKVYYFQTLTISGNTDYPYPNTPPFIKVKTEKESIPVRNDVIAMKVTIGDSKPAPGMLVVASIDDKASYPVTGWVGQGVAAEWVLIDTNNFYGKDGKNLQVEGGEQIKLLLVGGLKGSVETQDVLQNPKDTSGVQGLTAAASLPDDGSGSGPEPSPPVSPDSGGGGGGGGGAGCFIATAALGFETDSPVPAVYILLVIFAAASLWLAIHKRNSHLLP